MAETIFSNVCPADCDTDFVFPILPDDPDCQDYIKESQLTDLYISPGKLGAAGKLAPVSAWVDGVHTVTPEPTNIDNSDTTNVYVKHLVGIGGMPVPEKTIINLPKRRRKTLRKNWTVTYNFPNLDHTTREFLRSLECNPDNFTYWLVNEAHIYGNATGIVPVFVDVDLPLDAADDAIEEGILTLEFEGRVHPERKENPF